MAYRVPWKYLWVIGNLYEGTAWFLQLSWLGKKTPGFHELPGKNKQASNEQNLYRGKYKSLGPDVATGGCCQKGATADSQQSSPKHVVPVKTTHDTPPPPWTPATIQSHCPVDRETEICFFLRVSPLGMMHVWVSMCVWVCTCVRQGLSLLLCQGPRCRWYWFRQDLSEWCCFSDKFLNQPCLIRY